MRLPRLTRTGRTEEGERRPGPRRAVGWWALVCALVVGCAPGPERHLPLREGAAWRYGVQREFDRIVAELRVEGRVPVGDAMGWRLTGLGGDAELVWRQGRLLAGRLAGSRFDPPVPLFGPGDEVWKGTVCHPNGSGPASARLRRADDKVRLAGGETSAVRTTLTVRDPGGKAVVETWFVPRVGVVRQESRRDGRLLTRLDYVAGP